MTPRQQQRLAPDHPLEFAPRDDRPCERQRPDEDAEEGLNVVDRLVDADELDGGRHVVADADEHRSGTNEAVQDGHQLRHVGHRHP